MFLRAMSGRTFGRRLRARRAQRFRPGRKWKQNQRPADRRALALAIDVRRMLARSRQERRPCVVDTKPGVLCERASRRRRRSLAPAAQNTLDGAVIADRGAARNQTAENSEAATRGGGTGGRTAIETTTSELACSQAPGNSPGPEISGGQNGVHQGKAFQNQELPWHSCIRAITTTCVVESPLEVGLDFALFPASDSGRSALRHFSHPPVAASFRGCSLRAAAITNSGTLTPCDFAQATFCALVKQQHFFQHCSADRQPHGRFWQGNGCERSLPPVGIDNTGSGTSDAQTPRSIARPVSRRAQNRSLRKCRVKSICFRSECLGDCRDSRPA